MTKFTQGETRLSSAAPISGRISAAFRRRLGGVSTAALSLAMLLPAGAAFAQAPEASAPIANGPTAPLPASAPPPANTLVPPTPSAGQAVGEVVVTGSRIARRDYTSDSPIVTLGSQALENQADLEIQNTLNKLPEFTPDQNLLGANSVDVQPTPTHSVGITTVSLRGLGANRNLVLIDGQRAAPVNGSLVVDLSAIPQVMIDHVETITGGASAVYGADAVGGVVNFILKKNFQGLDLDIQQGINQTGDGYQSEVSALFGANFADDKGNLTIALERFNQDASLQKDHSFFTKSWSDPTVAGNGFFPFGFAYGGGSSQTAVNSIFGANAGVPSYAYFWLNNGQLFTGNSGFGATAPIAGAVPTVNGTTVALRNVINSATNSVISNFKDNVTTAYIQPPLDRWSMLANGHYDLNQWVTATFEANFAQTETNTLLTAPVSIITGWSDNVPYDAATDGAASGHPVPTQLATLLNARGPTSLYCLTGTAGCGTGLTVATTNTALVGKAAPVGANAPWTLSWLPSINGPLPPRSLQATNTQYQIRAGLEGKIPVFDWTWSLNGSHSESMEYNVAGGDYSLTRFQTLINEPNWGVGTFTGNQGAPNNGFGASTVTCTSGFYNALFNGAALSKDCLAAISAPLQSMDITKQDVVEFDTSGDLFKLPAGEVKASLGADYRRDSLVYNPDILQSNQSFTDQVIGVYPTAYENVSQDVTEGYGELSIPVIGGLPFLKNFTINPGLRYSSYNSSKGGYTYKMMGDLQVNDWIRFRGGYNVAVRAPNLGELYEGLTESYGLGSAYADPCSLLSNAPFGAGGAATTLNGITAKVVNTGGAAGAANALAVCKALMGGANSAAAQYYYNNPGFSQPAPAGQGFAFVNQEGNPNLQPETARTTTAGIVLKSPFADIPWASRATLSIDYYKIHINDAIEFTSIDYVYQNCLDQPAATALNSIFCQAAQRSPSMGTEGTTLTPTANLATIDTSGVDLQFDYALHLADVFKPVPGQFTLGIIASFLGNYDTIAYPGQAPQKWYGTLGPTLSGLDAGAYRYKLNTTFGYSVGLATINLNWRHLPQVAAAASVSPGNLTLPTAAYDIFDLSTIWNLPHRLQLRAGVQNLFDVQPPTTGATLGLTSSNGVLESLPSSGAGTTNASFYDEFGRRFYVGLKARF